MKLFIVRADAALAPIERVFALIAGVVILIMMCAVCAEVVGRSALNHPLRGTIDTVEQLMVVLVSLGVAYTQSHFGNVRMTLLIGKLRGRAKWFSELFSLSIASFVVAVLVKGSWANFMRSWNNGGDTPELGIPLWIGILTVTFALALLLLRTGLQLLEAIRLFISPASESSIFELTPDAVDTIPYE